MTPYFSKSLAPRVFTRPSTYVDNVFKENIVFFCKDCDKIVEFTSGEMQALEGKISHQFGFQLASQKVQLRGTCEQLKQSGSCENKQKCKAFFCFMNSTVDGRFLWKTTKNRTPNEAFLPVAANSVTSD